MGQFVQKCDFEIFVRKLMTRPHVSDVVFRNCHFSHFSLTKCVFWVCVILKIVFFKFAYAILKLNIFSSQFFQKCDFGISVRKSMTRPHVFDAVFRNCHFSHCSLTNFVFVWCARTEVQRFHNENVQKYDFDISM